jgi:hypothetical protein
MMLKCPEGHFSFFLLTSKQHLTQLPTRIYEVMRLENYPEIYTEALFQLTGGGRGQVYVNDMLGPLLDIESGNWQGNSPSASTFNIGSDPVLRALMLSLVIKTIDFRIGRSCPPLDSQMIICMVSVS